MCSSTALRASTFLKIRRDQDGGDGSACKNIDLLSQRTNTHTYSHTVSIYLWIVWQFHIKSIINYIIATLTVALNQKYM